MKFVKIKRSGVMEILGIKITWFIMIISMTGTVFNLMKLKWCFVIGLFINSFWIYWNFSIKEYPLAIWFIMLFGTSIFGLIKWHKEENIQKEVFKRLKKKK